MYGEKKTTHEHIECGWVIRDNINEWKQQVFVSHCLAFFFTTYFWSLENQTALFVCAPRLFATVEQQQLFAARLMITFTKGAIYKWNDYYV